MKDDKDTPSPRYAHSTVLYGDKLYLYGGVLGNRGPTAELWAFDISAKVWENIKVKSESCPGNYTLCGPLKSAGHTAIVVQDRMIVIFGHSPHFGYLNTVQEYYFGTREWRVVSTKGYPVKGGYGHTAAWDPYSSKIYVYGGVISESESTQVLSKNLYSYEPTGRVWMLLADAPSARFLHTATFISPGLMVVFGGNTHNDTNRSFGAKCYSSDLLAYDVVCDTWHPMDVPRSVSADLARYGHSGVVFDGSLYVYGGFDGQMLSDILKYTPGRCKYLTTQNSCLNTRLGVKCMWDTRTNECRRISRSHLNESDGVLALCPALRRDDITESIVTNTGRCGKFEDCASCVQTTRNCVWCGNKNCTYNDTCRDKPKIVGLEQCPVDPGPTCKQLHTCRSCSSQPNCKWKYENAKCIDYPLVGNATVDAIDQVQCPSVCSDYTSCTNCTQEECIWCQNEGRCVDKNAYTASFPYGQCREWTTFNIKCRTRSSQDKSQCSFYLTCAQCQADPACGWCDDGSNTGLGTCMPGGNAG